MKPRKISFTLVVFSFSFSLLKKGLVGLWMVLADRVTGLQKIDGRLEHSVATSGFGCRLWLLD